MALSFRLSSTAVEHRIQLSPGLVRFVRLGIKEVALDMVAFMLTLKGILVAVKRDHRIEAYTADKKDNN